MMATARLQAFCVLIFLINNLLITAREFTYTHNTGDQFRFLSTVHQNTGWAGEDVTYVEILNRISFSVAEVDAQGAGRLLGQIQTSAQNNEQGASLWERGYDMNYWREPLGQNRVAPHYFAPLVRHTPSFPARNLNPSDSWILPGEEVHDLRSIIGMTAPYKIPFTAHYTYVGDVEKDGKTYQKITIKYNYVSNLPVMRHTLGQNEPYLQLIKGRFDQEIYWDDELGQPAWYMEEYSYELHFSDHKIYLMNGHADAYLVEAKPMNKPDIVADLRTQIAKLGLTNVDVRIDEEGVTLVIENIEFDPNSAELRSEEKEKLHMIGQLLKAHSDRDLQITGHTAQAGSTATTQKLSEARALSVANFFINGKYKDKQEIIIKGMGARQPIAPNNTPEGMAKNRRVEITLLAN
jgi:outer membrane protein OmpA-like peptidoglycan-associated protein